MNNSNKSISVKLLGREYKITCPAGQEAELLDSALYLDRKMSEIRNKRRIYGIERISIMAALNLAHEILAQNHSRQVDAMEINSRLQQLSDKIDQALNKEKEVQDIEYVELASS